MQDPKAVLDSVLESEFEIDGLVIHPITLGRYALLELVKSPFLYPEIEFTVTNVLPSIYVMSQDIKQISKYNSRNIEDLFSKCIEWSEEKNLVKLDRIISAIIQRMKNLNDVSPQSSDEDKKKA